MKNLSVLILRLVLLAGLLAVPSPATAQSYWDPNGTDASPGSGGSGNWDNTTADWWVSGSSDVAWTTGNTANFAGTAGTVTMAAGVTADGLTFTTAGYTLSGSSTLTLGGTTPTITVPAGNTTIGCPLAGTSPVTVSGPGTLILSGANTYSGPTTISAGTLTIAGSGCLGVTATTTNYAANITNNGTFIYNSSAPQALSGTISGSGTLTVNGNGVTGQGKLNLNAANTYTGQTTVNNDLLLIGPTYGDSNLGAPPATLVANQLVLNNNMNDGANNFGLVDNGGNPSTLTLNTNRGIFLGANGGSISCYPGATMYVMGGISGTGPLYVGNTLVSYDGYVYVSGQCTYTGPTIISGGWLFLNANNCLPAGTPLTIGSSKQAVGYGSFFNMNGYSQTIGPLSSSTGIGGGGPNVGTPAVEFNAAGVTLTIFQTNNTTFGGVIGYHVSNEGGNLVVTVPSGGTGGTLTLNNTNTYTGTTTITMAPGAISGPTLALANDPAPPSWSAGYGAISNTSSIFIGAGGTFDVSGLASPFNLSGSTTLSASGAGTALGITAAAINGASGGTVNLGSQAISLTFTPTTITGDTTHPALYISQGALSLNGNTFMVNNAGAWALGAGTYLLIEQATGNITSSGSYFVSVSGKGLASGCAASIQVSGGNVNLVVVVASSQTDVWNGAAYGATPDWSEGGSDGNWSGGAAPTPTGWDNVYFAGTVGLVPVMDNPYAVNSLTFNSGAGSFTLTNSGGSYLTVGSGVTNNSTSAQTLAMPVNLFPDGSPIASQWNLAYAGGSITVVSNIVDAGYGLAVSGPGPLILMGTNSSYTGPTTIGAGGTLAIAGAGSLKGGSYAAAITNNGTINYNSTAAQTLSGTISGSGALTEAGTGTLTLSGANTYTGITTISNGSLVITKDSNLGAAPATAVANQLSMNCNIHPSGNTYNDYGLRVQSASFSLSATRGITLGANGGSINVQNTFTLTVPGVISGTGPFYASPNDSAGYGTIILSGANTYSGATFIGAGTLELGANNALPAGTPLTIGASAQGAADGSFFNMNGKSQTIGPLASSTGLGGTGTGTPTVELTGALTVFQTNANTTFAGIINGSGGSLTVTVPSAGTPGTLTLSGTNTYTGPTTISAGTLALSSTGSISNSPTISIGAGGTFDVSAISSYAFSSGTSLNASGAGTEIGSTAATIKGAASSGATVTVAGPLALTFTPQTFSGDLAHPALYSWQTSQGDLVLSGNAITVNNAGASPLGAGTYSLIQIMGGLISLGTPTLTVTGKGLAANTAASLSVSSVSLNLVVASTAVPVPAINSVTLSGANLIFSGTNGSDSGTYHVLTSTNVALPLSNWTSIATGAFSLTGAFSVTNAVGVNPSRFFIIQIPQP
ncbi:MAG: autotransporter-associated beta strand repeat-containing protein [Verrucomicrobiota bacterium]|jgi:autotransporter-associated beta strand protein